MDKDRNVNHVGQYDYNESVTLTHDSAGWLGTAILFDWQGQSGGLYTSKRRLTDDQAAEIQTHMDRMEAAAAGEWDDTWAADYEQYVGQTPWSAMCSMILGY